MNIPDTMDIWKNWNQYTTVPAMYESLAEECAELAKAALKAARVIRGENPTPVSFSKAEQQVLEEFTDVIGCAIALNLEVKPEQSVSKFERMKQRTKKAQDY